MGDQFDQFKVKTATPPAPAGAGDQFDQYKVASTAPTTTPPPAPVPQPTPEQPSATSRFFTSLKDALPGPPDSGSIGEFSKTLAKRALAPEHAGTGPIGLLLPTAEEAQKSFASVAPKVAQEAKATVQTARSGTPEGRRASAAHAIGTLGYGAATLAAPVGGTLMAKAGEQFGSGDVAGGSGTTTGLLLPFAAGEVASQAGLGKTASMSKAEAVDTLTKAINPVTNEVEGLKTNLNKQLDTIVRHAKTTGQSPTDLSSLADLKESAAKADPYLKTFIDPYANDHVTMWGGGDTTIGKIHERINTINDTLSPKYERGGAGSLQANQAVGAEDAARLRKEGTQLRNLLADELSKRTGIDAKAIRDARANYGQLRDLQESSRWYANDAQRKLNAGSNEQLTASDLIPSFEHPVGSAANKLGGKVPLQRNPVNKAIQKVFASYDPPYQPQTPLSAAPVKSVRSTPPWAGQGKANKVGATPPPEVTGASTPASSPAIPAGEPGLLNPGGGRAPAASSPLPFGPTSVHAGPGEMAGRQMTVGQQFPEINPVPPAIQDVLNPPSRPPALPPKGSTQLGPSSLPPEVMNMLSNNASGQTSASLEALNRLASEKANRIVRVRIDTRSGNEIPLIGPDAVDAKAGPYDEIVQRSPQGEVVDRKSVV